MGEAHEQVGARKVVVLIGLMGSGKSSVGRRLAHALGVSFYDTDELVATATKKSVRELFAEGEATFRGHERTALLGALDAATKDSGVIATGGGVITREDNRDDIRRHATDIVWLDADLEELVSRTSNGTHRPLLDGGARGKLEEMQRERSDLYESLATIRVATKGQSLSAITEFLQSRIGTVGL